VPPDICLFYLLSFVRALPIESYVLMRSVEEIEAEIAKLNPAAIRKVARWLAEYESKLWDKQIEEDAASGKLDRFINEALEEYSQRKTRALP
jgi:hypothetical protein